MKPASISNALPSELQHDLRSVARKMRLVYAARGSAIMLSVFIICMGASFVLDRFLVLSGLHRVLLLAGSVGGAAAAVALCLVKPLVRKPADNSLAFAVEAAHPELHESLASTVEILESKDSQAIKGSPELIQALVDSTVVQAQHIDFRGSISPRIAYRAVGVAAVVLAGIGVYAALQFNDFSHLFRRFLLANVPRLTDTRLTVGPGNDTILSGGSITVYANATGAVPEAAWVYYKPETGNGDRMRMLETGSGGFAYPFSNQQVSFRYSVRAGDALSPEYFVRVVPRPEVGSISITCTYPSYMGLQPKRINTVNGTVSELDGTKVDLKVKATQPLEKASISFKSDGTFKEMEVAESEAAFSFSISRSDIYMIRLVSREGFENLPLAEYVIECVPDRRPVVRIQSPGRNLSLPKAAAVDVESAVRDDFGIAKVELCYKVNAGDQQSITFRLPEKMATSLVIPYRWDLAAVDCKAGDEIVYKVSAFDRRGDEGRGDSSEYTIHIGLAERSPARKEQLDEVDAARKDLRKLAEKIRIDAEQVAKLKQAARNEQAPWTKENAEALKEAERRLEDSRKAAADVAIRLDTAMGKTNDRQLAEDLAQVKQAIEEGVDENLEHGEQQLKQAETEQGREERSDRIAKAETDERTAAENAEKLARQLDRIAMDEKLEDVRQAAGDLAHAEEQLERRLEGAPPRTTEEAQAAARDQQVIAQAAQAVDKDMQQLADEIRQPEPQAAQAIDQARQQLAAGQQKMQEAAGAVNANQMPQALQNIDQAEQKLSEARRTLRAADAELAQARQEAGQQIERLQPDIPQEARELARRQLGLADELQQAQQAGDEKAVERVRNEQEELAGQARELAREAMQEARREQQEARPDFRAAQDFADAAQALERLAEQPMADAADLLARPDQQARQQAQERQNEAARNLQEIAGNLDLLEAEQQLHEAARDAAEIAAEQRQLAQQARRANPEDNATLDDLADRQQELQQELAGLDVDIADAREGLQDDKELAAKLDEADRRIEPIPAQMNQAQQMLAAQPREAAQLQQQVGRELDELRRDLDRAEQLARDQAGLAREELAAAKPDIEKRLDDVLEQHKEAAEALEAARDDVADAAAPLPAGEAKALADARDKQAEAQEAARELAQELAREANAIGARPEPNLEKMGELDRARDALNRAADNPMEQAQADMAEAMAAPDKSQRREALADAAEQQQQALDELERAAQAAPATAEQQLRHAAQQAAELKEDQAMMAPVAANARPDDEENREVLADAQRQTAERAQDLADQAERLAKALEQKDPEAAKQAEMAAELGEPTRNAMQQAGMEMEEGRFEKAVPLVKKAENNLQQIENALGRAAELAKDVEPEQQQKAETPEDQLRRDLADVQEMAEKQGELAEKTRDLQRQDAAKAGKLADEQDELAKDLMEHLAATPEGKQAALEQARENLEELQQQAEDLARQQEDLAAGKIPPQPNQQTPQPNQQAQQPNQQATPAEAQQALRQQAEELAGNLEDVRDNLEEAAPETAEPLKEKAEPQAREAAGKMADAAKAMEKGAEQARPVQNDAAKEMAHAAKAIEQARQDVAEAARQAQEQGKQGQQGKQGEQGKQGSQQAHEGQGQGHQGEQAAQQQGQGKAEQQQTAQKLSEAADQMRGAARMLDQGADPQQVAQLQQQIQNALQDSARSMLASMAAMRQNKTGGSSGTGGMGQGTLTGEALPEAVMNLGEDWGKLPGNVRNEILQAMGEGYPKEFEKMIQIYFRGLAESAGKEQKQ